MVSDDAWRWLSDKKTNHKDKTLTTMSKLMTWLVYLLANNLWYLIDKLYFVFVITIYKIYCDQSCFGVAVGLVVVCGNLKIHTHLSISSKFIFIFKIKFVTIFF